MLNGPNAASRSIIGYDESSSGAVTRGTAISLSESADWIVISGVVGVVVSSPKPGVRLPRSSRFAVDGRLVLLPFDRGFDLRVRIEPAHVLTFFDGFFPLLFRFRGVDIFDEAVACVVVPSSGDSFGMTSFDGESVEPGVAGREPLCWLEVNGSNPKKDHRLGCFAGLGFGVSSVVSFC